MFSPVASARRAKLLQQEIAHEIIRRRLQDADGSHIGILYGLVGLHILIGAAGPRSLGSDSSPFPFDCAAGLDRSLPRMAEASRRLFADATSQAHEALSPAVLWRAGTTLPQSPAAALRMLTERTERGMYGTREHVLADIHRLGIGCLAAGGAMRAALEAAEVPAERCVVLPPGSLPRKEDAGNIAELLSCMCAPVHASAPHATAPPCCALARH